jgi:hypothetical protein
MWVSQLTVGAQLRAAGDDGPRTHSLYDSRASVGPVPAGPAERCHAAVRDGRPGSWSGNYESRVSC